MGRLQRLSSWPPSDFPLAFPWPRVPTALSQDPPRSGRAAPT